MAQFFRPAGDDFAGTDISLDVIDWLAHRLPEEYAVFIGARAGRQADIVIFSPWVVHVIEVKDKTGVITVDGHGRWLLEEEPIENIFAGRKESPPVQAQNTAKAFEGFLRSVYNQKGRNFRGKVYPYVLIPHACPETRSNLARWRNQQKGKWVQVATSLEELLTLMRRKDQMAAETVDFYFEVSDILDIASQLNMVPTDTIYGVKIRPDAQRAPRMQTAASHSSETLNSKGWQHPVSRQRTNSMPWPVIAMGVVLSICFGITFIAISLFGLWRIFALGPAFRPGDRENASYVSPPPFIQTPALSPVVPGSPVSLPSPTPSPFAPLPQPTPLSTVPSPVPPSAIPSPTIIIGEWSKDQRGLVLIVEKVEIFNDHFRVWMKAVNRTDDIVVLPLFGNFFVIDDLGNQYEADEFSSTFPPNIAPGAVVGGYAEIPTAIDPRAKTIKIMFVQIFGSTRFPYGTSIVVEDIPLR